MADVVVTNDVDTFLRSADNAAARTNLEVYSDAEVDAKVATKAVAGGVELDGNNIQILNSSIGIGGTDDFSIHMKMLKITGADATAAFLANNLSSTEGDWHIRPSIISNGDITQLRFVFWGTNQIAQNINLSKTIKEFSDVTLVFDRDANLLVYVNGELSGQLDISAKAATVVASGFVLVSKTNFGITCGGLSFFNRALSAADVTDLYESGTVAVADRWGDGAEGDTYTSDFSVDADGFASGAGGDLTVTGNTDSVSAVDDTLKATAVANVNMYLTKSSGDQMEVGIAYKVEFDYYADSGCGIAYIGLGIKDDRWDNGGVAVVEGSWQTGQTLFTDSAGSNLRTFAGFTTETGDTNDTLVSGTSIYFKNVKFTRLGAIADLPLDEGIGYQFHDRSSNHFDALASTSGVTHLVPKTEGYIRDFNVDAYNGGSGNVELVSSTQDIIPEDVGLLSLAVRVNGALAVSQITGKVSTRSARIDNVSSTVSLSNSNKIVLTGLGRKPATYNNYAVSSTDSDATDLNFRVDYKVIER